MNYSSVGENVDIGGSVRLSAAFMSYRQDVIVFRSQATSTENQHNQTLKSLLNFIGEDLLLQDLSFEHVRRWKQDMEKRKLSPQTIRNYLIKLRIVLGHMHLKGIECLDPALIHLPKRVDTVPQVINPAEVEQLINATPKLRNKALISFLFSTGLRISEACALDRMHVKEDFFNVIGKGGRTRLCFISPDTRILLNAYLKERTDGRTVYVNVKGKKTNRIRYKLEGDNHPALFLNDLKQRLTPQMAQKVFEVARRHSGLSMNVHPHTMRHSYATDLLKNGANVMVIKELLGHTSLNTTQQYLHIFDKDLAESHAKFHTKLNQEYS